MVMGKMKETDSASSTEQWDMIPRTVSFSKNIIQDYIDKNLLVEGAEDEKMGILNQPFLQHSTVVVSDHPFPATRSHPTMPQQ